MQETCKPGGVNKLYQGVNSAPIGTPPAQLEKVQIVPSRSGPAALVALAITTSGNDGVIAAWDLVDRKKVMTELVKSP